MSSKPLPTQERLRAAARGAIDKAVDATEPAARWLDEKKQYVSNEQQKLAQYVSSHPIKSMAMILVVGLVIGRIL